MQPEHGELMDGFTFTLWYKNEMNSKNMCRRGLQGGHGPRFQDNVLGRLGIDCPPHRCVALAHPSSWGFLAVSVCEGSRGGMGAAPLFAMHSEPQMHPPPCVVLLNCNCNICTLCTLYACCQELASPTIRRSYFTFWVILSIVWGFLATFIGAFLPFWESREALGVIILNLATCSPVEEATVLGGKAAFPASSFGKVAEEK